MRTEIAIIGGGLAGIALAEGLGAWDWRVFEARERLGGRISTIRQGETASAFDMGPAWIWPHNRRLLAATKRFGLGMFEQYATGTLAFQDGTGAVRRDVTMTPMAGSLRIEGGLDRLVQGYARELDGDMVHLSHRLVSMVRDGDGITLSFDTPDGPVAVTAARAVLALPPRLVAETVRFEPTLPAETRRAMESVPTWMAGHAKIVAIYDTPFWRDLGLSGDAISHRGPLAEIHDASPSDGDVGALFGFVGVSAVDRRGLGDRLSRAVIHQLGALFGEAATRPRDLLIKDWAADPLTATAGDQDPPMSHPAYGMPPALRDVWDGHLLFAGTEVAATEGGFLEGALEAADEAVRDLRSLPRAS